MKGIASGVAAKIFGSAAGKVVATAVVSVAAGGAVVGGVTNAVYDEKIAQYDNKIAAYENRIAEAGEAAPAASLADLDGQTLRVFDGIVQIWDGTNWTDYANVSDFEASDPYYGFEEKSAAVENQVIAEKLEAAGLMVNEEGIIVENPDAVVADSDEDVPKLVAGTIKEERTVQNNKQDTGAVPVIQVLSSGATSGVAGARVANPAAVAQTWTDNSGGSSSSSNYSWSDSSSSSGSSSPTPSYSAPSSDPAPAPSSDPAPAPSSDPAPSGGDSGGGGGDSGGGSSDSGDSGDFTGEVE